MATSSPPRLPTAQERQGGQYDPVSYKRGAIDNWNKVAPEYHHGWAGAGRGPFRSTAELVSAACIEPGHRVLDVACGTGAVSAEVARRRGPSLGMLAGFDFSSGALSIARSAVPSGHFAEMDAEHMGFVPDSFDRVLCQYALMFFPDPPSVLRQINILLRRGGRLAIAVHGTAQGVPYFSTVMEPVLRHIPGIRPEGTPTVHRFGNPSDLENLIASAGFEDIAVQRHVFDYETGTFDQYWSDYLATTANSIRPKIEAAGEGVVAAIRREAKQRAEQFIQKDGTIKFPWDVLVATALK